MQFLPPIFIIAIYSQTCVKRPYKIDIVLAFQTGGCLLLYESSAESSCMSFLHYFHAVISNNLSEKPTICLVVYGRLTQVLLHTMCMYHTNIIRRAFSEINA